jgi:hypothetical protein
MADTPAAIILQILNFLIKSAFETVSGLLTLLVSLFRSLAHVVSIGGIPGILLASVVVAAVGYFSIRFFIGSAKSLALLFAGAAFMTLVILFGIAAAAA